MADIYTGSATSGATELAMPIASDKAEQVFNRMRATQCALCGGDFLGARLVVQLRPDVFMHEHCHKFITASWRQRNEEPDT